MADATHALFRLRTPQGVPAASLRDVLEPQRQTYPTRVALFEEAQPLTYGQLAGGVAGVAQALLAGGIVAGDRVAMLMPNGAAFLECFFGITAVGAIVVPLNTRLHPNEHAGLLRDCRPRLLVAHGDYQESIDAVRAALPQVSVVVHGAAPACMALRQYEQWRVADATLPPVFVDAAQPAALLYTSGTTSSPKGVVLTHGNYLSMIAQLLDELHLTPDSVNLQLSPLYHAASIHTLMHLAVGGATVLQSRFEPAQVMAAVERHRVTYFFAVPTMLYQLLDHPDREHYDLSSLRCISYGAAAITGARLEQAQVFFGNKLLHAYGMTETTSHASVLGPDGHQVAQGSIGRGLAGVALRVVDDEDRDVAPGEVGEILVRGPNVMHGYWERPEETARALAGGWMHTGDLARVDPRGYLFIVDRKKDMIISGGVNVYPREAEEVLARHPAVAEVAVYGVADQLWGEALAATVVLKPGAQANPSELIEFARGQLAGFKLPKQVQMAGELPKTGSGKVQKTVLRLRHAATPRPEKL
ncbi:long-chain-fatty-acid--CoA ligase [Ramlibacter sp. RBP-2]|uniref:Long-chain-fatty-acid--CoA ligase n=1 Tax=Ramlibacter lithotrophicus TaxID=2606681 RepID=A0A7X6DFB2_9BURK|nr:long-chain-fatty-acid--CoA ligase [Ramlibacter lithotrophicus]NKE66110.1 long-chain-fatty-acid--CoA ligase [Ramlibacter lithotrophicus]